MAASPVADWRSAEPYAALHCCGRHGFAWEWLRRSSCYQAATLSGRLDAAARFGLHRFERFELEAARARPIWRAEADPFVLSVAAFPADGETDLFDATRFARLSTVVTRAEGSEHWLFSDGFRAVRLDVAGTLLGGPVRLEHRLRGLARARSALVTLQRLIGLAQSGTFVAGQFPRERRAARWALTLRVHDARAVGASRREIAAALFGIDAVPDWKVEELSSWSRLRRLQEAARRAAAADPQSWLSGDFR